MSSSFTRPTVNPESGETEITSDPFSGASMESGPSNKIDPERAAESLRDAPVPADVGERGTLRITFGADGQMQEFTNEGLSPEFRHTPASGAPDAPASEDSASHLIGFRTADCLYGYDHRISETRR